MRIKKVKKNVFKYTTEHMELCLVNPHSGAFPFTRYMVLPRARWGIPRIYHECDLLALSKQNVLHEIEIKISKGDLLADKRKRHSHQSDIIHRLWFAVPETMVDFAVTHIPSHAGLISCYANKSTIIRRPKYKKSEKPDEEIIKHMYDLLQMRYWSEKIRFHNRKNK